MNIDDDAKKRCVYQFTREELLEFLGDYCGVTWDASGEEATFKLLETLADQGKLTLLIPMT